MLENCRFSPSRDMVQHGVVEQAFQAGLVMAVEPGVFQHPLAALAAKVEMQAER